MAKILLYLLVICLFALLAYVLRERLGKRALPFFIALCVLGIVGIIFYELSVKNKDKKHEEILLAFANSKALICKNVAVTKDKFNYDYGTKSFIIKDKSVKSLIFNIKECSLYDE